MGYLISIARQRFTDVHRHNSFSSRVQTLCAGKCLPEYSLPVGVPPDLDNNSVAGLPVWPVDFFTHVGGWYVQEPAGIPTDGVAIPRIGIHRARVSISPCQPLIVSVIVQAFCPRCSCPS